MKVSGFSSGVPCASEILIQYTFPVMGILPWHILDESRFKGMFVLGFDTSCYG